MPTVEDKVLQRAVKMLLDESMNKISWTAQADG